MKKFYSIPTCWAMITVLACIFSVANSAYATPVVSQNAGGNYQPVLPGGATSANEQSSEAPRTLTVPEFLAADIGIEPVTPRTYPFQLDQKSVAVSRADRASFKALLVNRGLTYITDADINSLENNANAADVVVESYLLSVSGSRVAIAFSGGTIDGNTTQFFSKVAVFQSKKKQYEIEYPFVTNFEDFQMAFTKDGRLATAFYGEVRLESAKLDSHKRVTERSTDYYDIDDNGGAAVFQYNETRRFDPPTGKLTQQIVTFTNLSNDVDKQVQTFYYDLAGNITGFRQENFKSNRLIYSAFDTREPVDCGQPQSCSRTTSTTTKDFTYYSNGRLKQVITNFIDPDLNVVNRQVIEDFANTSRNLIVFSQDNVYSDPNGSPRSIRTSFFYHSNGELKKKVEAEQIGPDTNGISTLREITELFNSSGRRTEKTTQNFESNVLKSVETLTFYSNFIGGVQAVNKNHTIFYSDTFNQKASETTIDFNRSGVVENVVLITYAQGIRSRKETSLFSKGNLFLKLISTYNAAGNLIRVEVLYF